MNTDQVPPGLERRRCSNNARKADEQDEDEFGYTRDIIFLIIKQSTTPFPDAFAQVLISQLGCFTPARCAHQVTFLH